MNDVAERTLAAEMRAILDQPWPGGRAHAYCEHLARTHYENFHMGSLLLPRRLKPWFFSMYAYCRWSDDLSDEAASPDQGRRDLLQFGEWVEATWRGAPPNHPVFVALADTLTRFDLPKQPFLDLLRAFKWDLDKTRWNDFNELLEYCRYSANPVGRIVLAFAGVSDDESMRMSDATCTALQLANHWQDVKRDWAIGRVYVPQADLAAAGLSDADIGEFAAGRAVDERWRGLMRDLVNRARALFRQGAPLAARVPRDLRIDIRLFTLGGWSVLDAIERANYDVFTRRPALSKAGKAALFLRALCFGQGSMPA